MKEKIVFNWSGGKDSALCLYKVLQEQRYDIVSLLTSISLEYQRISMHGVRVELLEAQVQSIGLPLLKMHLPETPTMENYDNIMRSTLTSLKAKGVTGSVFGDIFLEDLRHYRETKLSELDLTGIFPLWKIPTLELIQEFIKLGFKTIITCVNASCLDKSFVGRIMDQELLNDLPDNVDPCGENGEFHTFVYDGPIFSHPILFDKGEIVFKEYSSNDQNNSTDDEEEESSKEDSKNPFDAGFWFCDLIPKN